MGTTLRVLIVEDSEDDAALLVRELRRGGYEPTFERIETPAAMSAALDREAWDLVISDYSMPHFGATAALMLLKGHDLDLPFIIVSGTIGEDAAVTALKAGAHDFVVKGNWARLIPAIQRELSEAEGRRVRREAESALRRSERRFAAFMRNLPGAAFIKDERGAYLYANEAVEAALRLKPGAWLGKTDDELLPPETAAQLKENDRAVRETGEALQTIETLPQVDGLHHWLIGKFPITDQMGRPSILGGIGIDITERKQAEEEIRSHAARAEALARTAARLNSQLDLEAVLNAVCEETARALSVPAAGVALYDPRREVLYLAATFGLPPEYRQNHSVTPRALHDEYARRMGALMLLPDIQALPGLPNAELYVRHNIRTIAAANLVREGGLVGTLDVYTFDAVRLFTADELALLQGLADQAAQAIANAHLFAESERRLDHVQALRNIDTAISASLDLRVTLNVFLEEVLRQLGVDAAGVLLLNAHIHTLEYAAGRGFRTKGIERSRPRLGEGYPGRAALERRTVRVPNLGKATGDLSRALVMKEEGFQAYYGVPLIAKGHVKGVLEIFHRAPLDPDVEWLDFLEALAGQAAIAVDNLSLFEDLQRSNTQLIVAYDATIEGWSRALDLRDKETEGHTQRVTEITLRLARALEIGDEELVHIRRGALLHDIGKMGVPDGILLKPGPLTDEEWVSMRKHPVFAYEMLSPVIFLRLALDIPYCHHEKWDGTGYPRGLKGEQIPLAARVFAVVDVWDALRSDRPYRPGWPEAKVREHIRSGAATHFDPAVVEAFLSLES